MTKPPDHILNGQWTRTVWFPVWELDANISYLRDFILLIFFPLSEQSFPSFFPTVLTLTSVCVSSRSFWLLSFRNDIWARNSSYCLWNSNFLLFCREAQLQFPMIICLRFILSLIICRRITRKTISRTWLLKDPSLINHFSLMMIGMVRFC